MPGTLQGRARFGAYELDPRAGELHHDGQSTILQEQQLKVLLMLIERAGEIATREEIRKKLWPNDTIVEFDYGINNTIKNLRRLLDDSAQNPQYIETVARRGYRLMVPVKWVSEAEDSSAEESSADSGESAGSDSESQALPKAKLKVGRLTGKVVSHYRVLEVIGGGGMGLVYRAEDLKLGRAVALKFLPEEVGDDPKARERFEREAHAVSALDHPNICTVYDFDEHEGHPFIAMQLLQGKTLRDHIAEGHFRLSRPEGLEIAIQIAAGLEAAHEKGIIHRDIKPANIFITEKNVAKILDFGVAKMVVPDFSPASSDVPNTTVFLSEGAVAPDASAPQSKDLFGGQALKGRGLSRAVAASSREEGWNQFPSELIPAPVPEADLDGAPQGAPLQVRSGSTLTRTGIKLGTAGYMSPEQIRGAPLDARTDIFSFGLVLYEMATGDCAFSGETEAILHEAIVNREPKPLRKAATEVSPGLESVINKCLEKECEERYQTAVDLRNSLQQVQNETATAREIKPQRRRWKYAVAVAAVIAIVAGGLYYRLIRNAHKLTDKDTTVLVDFDNKTGDAVLDDALNTALAVELQQSPFLNLLAPDKVRATLKRMNRPETEKMIRATALEVCRQTKSAALVTGSIADIGNQYKLSLKATDCKTGKEWTKAEVEVDARDQIVHALGEAGYLLRGKLGEPQASLRDFNQPLDVATSASPEALQAYAQGAREQGKKGDSAALPYLRRAVDLDPEFAIAHARVGAAYFNLNDPFAAHESFQRAFNLRDRASRRARFYIEGNYYGGVTGELEKSQDAWARWIKALPRDYVPHNNLSHCLRMKGEYQHAIAEARESIRLNPDNYPAVFNLMISEMAMERLEEAKATYNEARSHETDSALVREARHILAFLQKDEASMQEQVRWASDKPGAAVVLSNHADTESYYGRRAKAHEFSRMASEASQRDNSREEAASWVANEALIDAEIGYARKAEESLRQEFELNNASDVEVVRTFALARSGHAKEAEQGLEKLGHEFPLDTSLNAISFPSIRAAIDLHRGNPRGAIRHLEAAAQLEFSDNRALPSLYPAYLRGIGYLQVGEPLKAQVEFQKLVDHPGIVRGFVIGALAHVQLARAQAMMGDQDAARKSYQDFLTLWKDADPDIPIYKQAKAEYKKLKK